MKPDIEKLKEVGRNRWKEVCKEYGIETVQELEEALKERGDYKVHEDIKDIDDFFNEAESALSVSTGETYRMLCNQPVFNHDKILASEGELVKMVHYDEKLSVVKNKCGVSFWVETKNLTKE